MKLMSRLVLVMFLCIGLAQAKTVRQIFMNVPDTTAGQCYIYDLWQDQPGDFFLDQNHDAFVWLLIGTMASWTHSISSYPWPDWQIGDTCVCFGSIDTAYQNNPSGYGDNPNHTGFYWVFSDTTTFDDNQLWNPRDTLRVMPYPTVSQDYTYPELQDTTWDSVIVDIPNPAETPSPNIDRYDVMGYWLLVNAEPYPTPAAGTPNSYTDTIGYFPVQGGPGDHTFIKYWPDDFLPTDSRYNTYHAYHIVFNPAFTTDQAPGYMTTYMSQNSNPAVITLTGIEEQKAKPKPSRMILFAAPSITKNRATINYALTKTTSVTLSIYNASGQLVSTLVDGVKPAGEHTTVFDGNDLPSGIYFCTLRTPERQLKEKLTLLR